MTNSTHENASDARERYQSRIEQIDERRAAIEKIDAKFGFVRVILFFLAITTGLFAAFADVGMWVGIAGILAFVAFLVVVVLNEPYRDKLEEIKQQRGVIRRLCSRVDRNWEKLDSKKSTEQLAAVPLTEEQKDLCDDLDLLGRVSLFHFVSMAATTPGIRTLAQWLAGTAEETAATERAQAVRSLAPLRDQRIRFYTLAREIGGSSGDPDEFVRWAGDKPWLKSRMWLMTWANLSLLVAAVMVIAIVGSALGILPPVSAKIAGLGLVGLATVNMILTSVMLGPANAIFSVAMSSRQSVANYQELFGAAENLPESESGESGMLAQIRSAILDGDHSARAGMADLQSIAKAGSMRQSALTFFPYVVFQAFGLWDVRVLKRLEAWQARYANDVQRWFTALGELEALMSVAAIADEYPEWTFPIWAPASDQVVSAKSVGHPLLPDDARVCNDVNVGPPGTILLVTGSNMSGKSTMLRSLGLNISLAGIGAPVCASEFRIPSVTMATSIRVRDNLGEGVSFYMAELKRLKSVVDQARQVANNSEVVLLFLLDEILQGTNSRERQIAVVKVLQHLMDSNSIGAISTHDLELADEPKLQSVSTTVHFRETIRPDADGNEQMTFDYQMRQGVSPTTNALRLLEMVGLGGEADDS